MMKYYNEDDLIGFTVPSGWEVELIKIAERKYYRLSRNGKEKALVGSDRSLGGGVDIDQLIGDKKNIESKEVDYGDNRFVVLSIIEKGRKLLLLEKNDSVFVSVHGELEYDDDKDSKAFEELVRSIKIKQSDLNASKEAVFYSYFNDKKQAEKAKKELEKNSFVTDLYLFEDEEEDYKAWSLKATKTIEASQLFKVEDEVMGVIEEHGGEYDGNEVEVG